MLILKRLIGSVLVLFGIVIGVLPFIQHVMNDRNDSAFRALGTGAAPIAIGVWLWQRPKRKASPEQAPLSPGELAVRSAIAESRDHDSKPLNIVALFIAAVVIGFCIPPVRNFALTGFQDHPFIALLICGGIVFWVGWRVNRSNDN